MISKQLFSPSDLKSKMPLCAEHEQKIANFRDEIEAILNGYDERLLLIVGPCSIHNVESGLEYAKRLTSLSKKVSDTILIVMRTYFEKPRTLSGWKGFLYDPFLDGSQNIEIGLQYTRSFLLDLAKIGLPTATEFLDPFMHSYFSDLISWGCIGARTVQSPIHRQFTSSLPMPIGFKNRQDGNVITAIQAAQSSKLEHTYLGVREDGQISICKGKGNRLPHVILRGGEQYENYSKEIIISTSLLLSEAKLSSKLIVDCSHDNSKKNLTKQSEIFKHLIDNVVLETDSIKGIMLESFLLEGTKDSLKSPYTKKELHYGASHTDPCISWERTETLILEANETLRAQKAGCIRTASLLSSSLR